MKSSLGLILCIVVYCKNTSFFFNFCNLWTNLNLKRLGCFYVWNEQCYWGRTKTAEANILINYCPFNIITLPNTFRIFYHPHVFMNTIQSCYSSFSCKSFWVCWPWGNWWGCRPNFWKMDCVSLENTCCAPVLALDTETIKWEALCCL